MADPSDYRARWKLQGELAESCAAALPRGADWEIVFRFYGMVHLVEGYLRTKDRRFWCDSHEQRKKRFKEAPEIGPARVSYAELENLSKQVRYDPAYKPRTQDFANAKAWARKIESVVGSKLDGAIPQRAPPIASPEPPPPSSPTRDTSPDDVEKSRPPGPK